MAAPHHHSTEEEIKDQIRIKKKDRDHPVIAVLKKS